MFFETEIKTVAELLKELAQLDIKDLTWFRGTHVRHHEAPGSPISKRATDICVGGDSAPSSSRALYLRGPE